MAADKMILKMFSILALAGFILTTNAIAASLTLRAALQTALDSSPNVAASAERARAERAQIESKSSLANPQVGIMHSENMSLMEKDMGPMNVWSVSQKIDFPTKYFLRASAQRARATAAKSDLKTIKLQLRKNLIANYFNLYAIERIIALLEAQRETLREVAGSAGAREASGLVSLQDEMKAHVELTNVEAEILLEGEKRSDIQAILNELMNRDPSTAVEMPSGDLPVPKFTESPAETVRMAQSHSSEVRAAQSLVQSKKSEKQLAFWNFAPDFNFTYEKAFDTQLANAYSVGISVSLPLWFFSKQDSEVQAATASWAAAEKQLEVKRIHLAARVNALIQNVQTHRKLLDIYKTSLIPQATTTLDSSRGAYNSGKISFIELLDSERSLYSVRMAYFRVLSQYVDDLAKLEEATSSHLSTLPWGIK